jgi:hypothetical protein
MFARNPKTGAPIRLLRSEVSLWRNKKTLVWLQEQHPDVPWDRWDTLCVGLDDIQIWNQNKKRIDYLVLPESTDASVKFFLSLNPADYKMMFIPKAMVLEIGWQKFKALQITNVIILEEAHMMYPFLGTEWDRSKEDAVVIVTAILRISYLSGMASGYTSARLEYLASESIAIQCINQTPMPLWYITQYYTPDKARRGREIKKCLDENAKCSAIDKLVLLNEKDFSAEFPKDAKHKIHQEVLGKRLTYKMVVEWITNNVPDDVICIFGNADIYLDQDSWRDIWSVDLNNVFLALLRWDVQEGNEPSKLFGPRNDSQDTWGFLSTSVKSKQWDLAALDFPFGKAGCDNAITVEMLRKKFLIVNPALSLKTHHLQLTNYRTYDPTNVVEKPAYMYVDPTGIHDMEPVFDVSPYKFETINYGSFERKVRGVKSKALDVYCKMLERGERYLWKATSTNPHPAQAIQLYKYTNSFQTPQGLTYGYNKIFIGKEDLSKELWSKSELSPIHPAYKSERCFAVPWEAEFQTSPLHYIVSFLPKIFTLRERFGKGEFFAPDQSIVPFLECFEWNEANVPVLTHKSNIQIWCKELIQYPVVTKQEIHTEDIDTLRKYLKVKWDQYPTTKKWAVMIDGKYITTEMVRSWEKDHSDSEWAVMYENRTSPDRMLEKIRGASGFIYYGGSKSVSRWGMSWALPRGADVIEIQNEMDPDGEAAHFSGAAGLVHSLVIVPRASDKVTQEMISTEVSATMKGLLVLGPLESTKPTIYMPRKSLTGFFSHAGDSFREMVELWAEQGFVTAVEDPKAVQVWLDGVGKTLLYDRPTLDWLYTAPPEEQSWELALFGNPTPSDSGGPAKSWFFWPRRPRFVEECVAKGLPKTSWSERSKSLVFYGKIENKVQEKRRKLFDWSSVCDDYVMVNGEGAAYPFSQMQYLEKLAQAKFGLCLAGYGKKCHREVECMAMGCVPVVTLDVDMESYANPPQEGVHYLRVTTPEEVNTKVNAVSEDQWATMSAACLMWWKENASVSGSWNLTQKLKAMA